MLRRTIFKRLFSTAAPSEPCTALHGSTSPAVLKLCSEISALSLGEVADLAAALRTKLGLSALSSFSMGGNADNSQSKASAPAGPAAEAVPLKSDFKISLLKFEPTSKAKVIKEVKSIFPQMNLVEAKNFVEALPKVLREKLSKEESERMQKAFEAIGASVCVE